MADGFHAPLLILGLSNSPGASVKPGYRSLLAPWIGGASSTPSSPVVIQPGYRGLMAFWMGGASNFGSSPIPPIPPIPPVSQLDGRRYEWIFRDDEDICLILASVADCLF